MCVTTYWKQASSLPISWVVYLWLQHPQLKSLSYYDNEHLYEYGYLSIANSSVGPKISNLVQSLQSLHPKYGHLCITRTVVCVCPLIRCPYNVNRSRSSPYRAFLHWVHFASRRAIEGLRKFLEVRQRANDSGMNKKTLFPYKPIDTIDALWFFFVVAKKRLKRA